VGLCILAAGLAVQANPSQVFVNAGWTGPDNCGGHIWQNDAFATMQGGIDAVAPAGTVTVAAGAYVEQLVIGKSLSLLGPGAGIDPNGAKRIDPGQEARLFPPRHDISLPAGIMIAINADNVTVSGLTLDGDNPGFSGGVTVNGSDINAGLGIGNLNANLGGVLIAYNIIKNCATGGVRFDCPALPHQAKGINAVMNNRIANLAPEGLGVRANGQYLRVVNNTILGATYGIQMHYVASTQGTSIPTVTGNTVEATTAGIMMGLFNDQERKSGPSALVNHNIVRMTTVNREDFPATGLYIYYIEHNSQIMACDNTFSGGDAGIMLWELPTFNPTDVTITDTTINNARYGIWFRNWLPMPETGPARSSGAVFSDVTIKNAAVAGICLEGDVRGDGPVTAKMLGVTVQGGPVGLLLKGPKIVLDGLPKIIGQTKQAIVTEDGAQAPAQ